ncbi:MAG: hypothetical protein HY344_01330 [Candidatus Levybacteria bacterium]|nr:hypothetical protein [Candidatus Levybacteria bacterium]
MDIAVLSKDSLKIKIKKTSLIVDPKPQMPKTEADAIISLEEEADVSRVNDFRVLINEAGEYEVGGLKISSFRVEKELVFSFSSEGVDILLAKASGLSKVPSDKLQDYGVVIVNVDVSIPQNAITSMEPRAVVLYGEHAREGAKALGSQAAKSSKVSISENSLPEETEIYLLS